MPRARRRRLQRQRRKHPAAPAGIPSILAKREAEAEQLFRSEVLERQQKAVAQSRRAERLAREPMQHRSAEAQQARRVLGRLAAR
jgi:hypothetical protein